MYMHFLYVYHMLISIISHWILLCPVSFEGHVPISFVLSSTMIVMSRQVVVKHGVVVVIYKLVII